MRRRRGRGARREPRRRASAGGARVVGEWWASGRGLAAACGNDPSPAFMSGRQPP
ncbi:hypothetical protein BP1258A_3088 [Burkholderia pseudomallei 1258a]|nr:hypothetical protein BP1258A_3088 [Burkholderia pseudomallei 1258a]EIF61818.1 hypothetical protein BP1258B_3464 [Burkholderia pseudomallei 1258b]